MRRVRRRLQRAAAGGSTPLASVPGMTVAVVSLLAVALLLPELAAAARATKPHLVMVVGDGV